jgi:hypothetical protein
VVNFRLSKTHFYGQFSIIKTSLALKLGFEFARAYPGYIKIGEDFVSSKTFRIEKVREALLEQFQELELLSFTNGW